MNSDEKNHQESVENGTAQPSQSEETHSFRIGEYLSRQRQLRGFTLDELEEITRIPKRSLERLEAGAFDGQDDGFARGFVRTVAQALGLDTEETTLLLLSEPTETEPAPSWRSQELKWGLIAVILVLLGASVWLAREVDPQNIPLPEPEEEWVRHDAVRALAGSVAAPDPSSEMSPSDEEK